MMKLTIEQLPTLYIPVPCVRIVIHTTSNYVHLTAKNLKESAPQIFCQNFDSFKFRSVKCSRYKTIVYNGIDVEPTDSVIYAGCFEKALEYGDWPKIVMGLDQSQLKPSCKIVDSNIPAAELRELQKIYPTKFDSVDGSNYWLSRLPKDDTRVITDYEKEYGCWISGDPFDCLKMILIVMRPSDSLEQLLAQISEVCSEL